MITVPLGEGGNPSTGCIRLWNSNSKKAFLIHIDQAQYPPANVPVCQHVHVLAECLRVCVATCFSCMSHSAAQYGCFLA